MVPLQNSRLRIAVVILFYSCSHNDLICNGFLLHRGYVSSYQRSAGNQFRVWGTEQDNRTSNESLSSDQAEDTDDKDSKRFTTSQQSEEETLQERIDRVLDTPFFQPEEYDGKGPLKWFANLVQSDYPMAEALFAGAFFVVLVICTQEALRMQLYGDNYVPFRVGGAVGGGGSLF